MLGFRLVYHDGYDLNLGAHVFPSQKYRLIRERLLATGFAEPGDFLAPEAASEEDLLLVHERDWVGRLRTGTLTYEDILRLEIPYSRRMVDAFWLAAGGTILAARRALNDGIGYNIGGGFHHAYPGHGEGFCAIHDVAVAVRALQKEGTIARALVVDCDVHHGNGTAAIFADDPSVFTLSIHQFHNYPFQKPPSTLDIHLEDGVGDEEYLAKLARRVWQSGARVQPRHRVLRRGRGPLPRGSIGRAGADTGGVARTRQAGLRCPAGATYPGGGYAGGRLCAQHRGYGYYSLQHGRRGAGRARRTRLSRYPTMTLHKVKAGDTLGKIAKRFGVPVEAIVLMNGIANPDRIRVGQDLPDPGGLDRCDDHGDGAGGGAAAGDCLRRAPHQPHAVRAPRQGVHRRSGRTRI